MCNSGINELNAVRIALTFKVTRLPMADFATLLPQIIKNLHASYGDNFFKTITLELNQIIGADYTFIARIDNKHNNATTISLVAKGAIANNFTYSLVDTPCAKVVDDNVCIYPKNICQLFPNDQLLKDMNIEGYIGVPLHDSNNDLIGIIVTLHSKEIKAPDTATTLFELFSGRIAAEIERHEQKIALEQLNKKLAKKVSELTESKNKLAIHLQNTPLACITWDVQLHCLEWNKAAEHIFGFSANETIGKSVIELIFPKNETDKINHFCQFLNSQTHSSKHTLINITKTGKQIKCNWYNTPIIAEDGVIKGVASLIHDISEQEHQEELLRRSQKMEALGTLTGGIAHDQNNILGIILGYSEILASALSNDPKLMNYAKKIQHACIRGTNLISKLLAFSRTEPLSANHININKLLLEQQDVLQKTLTVQIHLALNLANDLWPVYLDANDFHDAILNLSINAMHAIHNKHVAGNITISTTNVIVEHNDSQLIDIPAGDYIKLSVSDNGCGMSKKIADKIFDPFFSTKGQNGTGLGLSQVFSFIKRSKGGITVNSTPEEGCEISLYFPRSKKQLTTSPATKPLPTQTLTGDETILVVDDEEGLRNLCYELLRSQGYKVFSADGHQKALELLARESIDLMLSDVIMPEMNGYELAKCVMKHYPHVKILLTSGYTDDDIVDDSTRHLSEQLLAKPYDANSLFERVRQVLDR